MRFDPDHRGNANHLPSSCARTTRRIRRNVEGNVIHLLDLPKSEKPRTKPDDFKTRMAENIAALIVLGVLVGVASADVMDIEKHQDCARIWECGH